MKMRFTHYTFWCRSDWLILVRVTNIVMGTRCTVKIRALVVRDNTAPQPELLRRHGLQHVR